MTIRTRNEATERTKRDTKAARTLRRAERTKTTVEGRREGKEVRDQIRQTEREGKRWI